MNCSFDPAQFLAELRRQCISVWPDPDSEKLHIWPASQLSLEQVTFIRKHKGQIIACLRRCNADLLPDNATCEAWRRRYANTGNRTP